MIRSTNVKRSVLFLVAPNDKFPSFHKEGEGDDKNAHREIFSSISYLKHQMPGALEIDYFNFVLYMLHNDKIRAVYEKLPSSQRDGNIRHSSKIIMHLIKKYDYYVFFLPHWNESLETNLQLAALVKVKYPDSTSIFMGPCCNLYPDQIGNDECVDYVITSEPEEALAGIFQQKDKKEIINIAYRRNGKVITNPERGFDLAKKSFCLDYTDYFNFLEKYNLPDPPYLYFEFSRGCIYRCFFCSLWTYYKPRHKRLDFAIQELEQIIKKTGIRYFIFNDNELNFDPEYQYHLLDRIIEAKLDIYWSVYMVAKNIDLKLLQKIKAAGGLFLRWGLESANPKKQEIISKDLDPNEVLEIMKMSSGLGIKNQISFSIGYPYDSEIDRLSALQFIDKVHPYVDCVNLNKFAPRRKSLSFLKPHDYGIKILSDNLRRGPIVWEEEDGLDWYLKKEQQEFYQKSIEERLAMYGLCNYDPEVFFINLINEGKFYAKSEDPLELSL